MSSGSNSRREIRSELDDLEREVVSTVRIILEPYSKSVTKGCARNVESVIWNACVAGKFIYRYHLVGYICVFSLDENIDASIFSCFRFDRLAGIKGMGFSPDDSERMSTDR